MEGDAEGIITRADQLRGLGQHDRARTLIDDALGADPENPDLLFEHALLLTDAGTRWGLILAESTLREVIAAEPDRLTFRVAWATVMSLLGHLDEARSALLDLLAVSPDLAEAHLQLAITYLGEGDGNAHLADEELARAASRRSLELTRGSTRAYLTAITIERHFGHDAEALRLTNAALETDPTNQLLQVVRAELAPLAEQASRALDLLTLDPTDGPSRSLLDAVVTWRRRAAATPLLLAALLPGLLLVLDLSPALPAVGAVASLVVCALAGAAYRDFRRRLPSAYLALRRTEFRQGPLVVGGTAAGLVVMAVGAAVTVASRDAAAFLLLIASLIDFAVFVMIAWDDHRILYRAQPGEASAYGTAYRFARRRLELGAWTAVATAVVGLVIAVTPYVRSDVDPTADVIPFAAVGAAFAVITIYTLVETVASHQSVPLTRGRMRLFRARRAFSVMAVALTMGGFAVGAATGFTLDDGAGTPHPASTLHPAPYTPDPAEPASGACAYTHPHAFTPSTPCGP